MASDSHSIDRPDVVVTIVGCPMCKGKFPTEDRHFTKCIYCGVILSVAEDEFGKYPLVDFIFLDDKPRAFRVRIASDGFLWLYYLHPDNKWVALRKATQAELDLEKRKALPREQAPEYEFGVPLTPTPKRFPPEDKAPDYRIRGRYRDVRSAAANDDS